MSASLPKYVVVNLSDLETAFEAGETVTLEAVKAKGLLNISGRAAKLPLKVLGDGELSKALTIKAAKFTAAASEKIAAAGATAAEQPLRTKWTRRAHERVRGTHGASLPDLRLSRALPRYSTCSCAAVVCVHV